MKRLIKIASIILIQTFLLLDIVYAAGQDNNEMLAPKMHMDAEQFGKMFNYLLQKLSQGESSPEQDKTADSDDDPIMKGIVHDLKNKIVSSGGFANIVLRKYNTEGFTEIIKAIEEYKRITGIFETAALRYLSNEIYTDEVLEILDDELLNFRTVIASLKDMLKQERYAVDKRLTGYLNVIIEEAEKMHVIIFKAINWSGRSTEPLTDLGKAVDEVVESAKKNPFIRDMEFEIILSDEVKSLNDKIVIFNDRIFTYKGILQMVIEELIKNASKYSETKKVEIFVSLSEDGSQIEIKVKDYGKGMPPEILERLGKGRVTEAKDKKIGTGLGIYTLKATLESVGGRLDFKNNGSSGFSVDEFTDILPVSSLIKAVNGSGISMPNGNNDIDKLNNLLKTKELRNKFSGLRLPPQSNDLIKREAQLTENELMQLNRLVLETAYPQQCPKRESGSTFSFSLPLVTTLDVTDKPRLKEPVAVAVCGRGGSGRRVTAVWLASKLGLRTINGGFLMRVLVYKLLEEKEKYNIDLNDQAAVAAYVRRFLEQNRIDYSTEPIKVDGVDTAEPDEDGLALRDRIKNTIDKNTINMKLFDRIGGYQAVRVEIENFLFDMADKIKKSGKYNGVIIRLTAPIEMQGIINVILDAPVDIRAKRLRHKTEVIEERDITTKVDNLLGNYPQVKKIDTYDREKSDDILVEDVGRQMIEYIYSLLKKDKQMGGEKKESLIPREGLQNAILIEQAI